MKNRYSTWVNANLVYQGEDLETAIRTWDAETFNRGRDVTGGISVVTLDGDVMLRDGWILHIREEGAVYLNPNLKE